jgi:hypothetical protein
MPLLSYQFIKNWRGCFVIGLTLLAFVLLVAAIRLGWLGNVDGGKTLGFQTPA